MVSAGAFSVLGAWFYRHALRAERDRGRMPSGATSGSPEPATP